MRAVICPNAMILTKAQRAVSQYECQGAYCGLSTASEVFLIFNTQISAQLRHLNCTTVNN